MTQSSNRFIQGSLKVLFWLLLPAFGLSLGVVLIRLQFLETGSLLEFLIVMGVWIMIWGVFSLAAWQFIAQARSTTAQFQSKDVDMVNTVLDNTSIKG